MNRLEFLTSLRYSLEKGGLAKSEIDDALSYYEEIFLDAGQANEAQTAESLGNPEELAREILIENGIHADGKPEFEMEDVKTPTGGDPHSGSQFEYSYGGQNGSADSRQPNAPAGQEQRNNFFIKLLLILVTIPIWVPCMAAVMVVAIVLFAIAVGLFAALAAIGFGFTIGGICALFAVPPVGLCLVGAGLVALGLFGLICIPMVKLIFKGGVALVNGAVNLVRRIFNIGGVSANG